MEPTEHNVLLNVAREFLTRLFFDIHKSLSFFSTSGRFSRYDCQVRGFSIIPMNGNPIGNDKIEELFDTDMGEQSFASSSLPLCPPMSYKSDDEFVISRPVIIETEEDNSESDFEDHDGGYDNGSDHNHCDIDRHDEDTDNGGDDEYSAPNEYYDNIRREYLEVETAMQCSRNRQRELQLQIERARRELEEENESFDSSISRYRDIIHPNQRPIFDESLEDGSIDTFLAQVIPYHRRRRTMPKTYADTSYFTRHA
ncbi:hypothetical protein BDA99DRAFT_610074 [Phascolomyces articulosus]|uniref:Uncharacterized protein n=1 Tax=Phascolomyces articulosus TaxID=60185 RepID=A0AAD5P782_9FUNG|nr:hypothetical protein BDA99DRAFT_610074 [Phascolomyces articulosus]